MIEVDRLTKNYGNVVAVRNVSFQVGPREVVGVLGPNGAGKSTLLRVIAGFLGPTSGRVLVGGFDVTLAPQKARACLGYMPETTPLYRELRVNEYLRFRAELKGVPRAKRTEAVQRALELTGARSVGQRLILQLSKGYRQRVGLADAMVSNPPLLILDEPTAGLDPNQIREARALIRELGKEHTVLLSTHILSEVEATCDRALVIDHGNIAAHGTLEELRREATAERVELVVRATEAALLELLGRLPEKLRNTIRLRAVTQAESSEELCTVTLELEAGHSAEVLIEALLPIFVGANLGVQSATPKRASLEDVFTKVTGTAGSTETLETDGVASARPARGRDKQAAV